MGDAGETQTTSVFMCGSYAGALAAQHPKIR
jgi:hypothetical protein